MEHVHVEKVGEVLSVIKLVLAVSMALTVENAASVVGTVCLYNGSTAFYLLLEFVLEISYNF